MIKKLLAILLIALLFNICTRCSREARQNAPLQNTGPAVESRINE